MNGAVNIGNNFFVRHKRQVILGIVFILTYFPTLLWMWDRWFVRDSYYSHGILIPLVVGYLIWYKRRDIVSTPIEPSPWGVWLIVLGLCIHILSSFFRVYFSSSFSMMIVLAGIILHFYGKTVFRKVAFPVCFLIFMMPLPLVVVVNISFKLKLFAAHLAALILNAMGLHAVQEGSIIKMSRAYVIVDDVCSGLRSLISLMALGSIFAYWMKGSTFKRILVFLSTIPIAVVTNVFRVIVLSSVSEIWGPRYAIGFLHNATGLLVFGLAFILLYGVVKLIE